MFQPAGKRAKLHFLSYLFRHAPFSISIAGITAIAHVSPVIAQVAVRSPDLDLRVNTIQNINGQVWLGTNQGAYRVDGDIPKRIGDPNLEVNRIENINGQVWLAAYRDAYRVDGNTPKRIGDSNLLVNDIQNIDGQVWLATEQGAYRVDGDTPKRIGEPNLELSDIQNINGQVWLTTDQDLYRVDGDTPKRIGEPNLLVNYIENINGQVWLSTEQGLYRVDGDTPKRIADPNLLVNDIENINGQVWLATEQGAYRVDGNTPKRIGDSNWIVNYIENINGQVWLTTYQGLYRVDGDTPKRIGDSNWIVNYIENINGQVWLTTDKGAYRVDEDVTIAVELDSKGLWWQLINKISPLKVWVSPVMPKPCYTRMTKIAGKPDPDSIRCGNDPYDKSFRREFKLIMETDKNEFDKAVKANQYNPRIREQNISNGLHTVYISIRDQWGNTFNHKISIFIAGPEFILFLIAGFWGLLLVVVILLAPYCKFCHYLLMNPNVRKYGSFGLFPLLITVVPPVRRHILRRYLREICREPYFSEWQQQFVIPELKFSPENFGKKLEKSQRHSLFLLGQSGIGKTSYFRYLTISYAQKQKNQLQPKNVVPIFLPLARYQEEEPENIFHAQLFRYGQLTDKELNAWFLQQGGFLILIDGLNEVNKARRQKISSFVDQYSKVNYFCLSSQENYLDEFQLIENEGLTPLDSSKIKVLLERKLGLDQAKNVIRQLNEETYRIYQIPQNLEFAIELIQQNKPFPQTERELYEATLNPILDSWCQNGRGDYPDILFERAYKMFKARNTFFDRQDEPVPDELRNDLIIKKFLIRRDQHYYFRHDLIRAYLAAKYFVRQWQTLLNEDNVTVDNNWRSILEFTIFELETKQASEVKDLLFAVLKKNEKVAGELFNWLQNLYPNLCESWTDDFTRSFGAATLAQI